MGRSGSGWWEGLDLSIELSSTVCFGLSAWGVAPMPCQSLTAGNGLQALTVPGVHRLLVQVETKSESECTPSSICALVTMSQLNRSNGF